MSSRTGLFRFSPDYVYVEPPAGFADGLAHFGRLRYSRAMRHLGDHTHRGAMEICYLRRGRQIFTVGKRRFVMRGGDVFVARPDEIHGTGGAPMEKSVLYWIAFRLLPQGDFLGCRGKEADALRGLLGGLERRVFEGSDSLGRAIDRMVDACRGDDPLRWAIVRNACVAFVIDTARLSRQSRVGSVTSEIGTALTAIDARLDERINLRDLAALANLSLPRFKHRFKAETGVPPNEYILRRKIEQAQELIRDQGLSVTAAAIDLGFSSSQYFATVFRRITGMSPKQWARLSS